MTNSLQGIAVSGSSVEEKGSSRTVSSRLVSLDAFRGFTMLWIIGGGSLVTGLQALGHNWVIDAVVKQCSHSAWQGLHYNDLIWPSFLFMVGASVPFSYAKRACTTGERKILLQALRRAAILFLLGSLRQSVFVGSPELIELSSALQPIAVAYLAAVFLAPRPLAVQAAVCGSILVGYALLLAFVPAPGIPAGTYEKGANLVLFVDQRVLGRTHPGGWGTVLSTVPTIATGIVGLMVGGILMRNWPQRRKMKLILLLGVSGVACGLALSPFIPVIMRIWTTSYGLLSAGCACLLFLFFYWIIDVCGYRRLVFPFVVIGMNALTIYIARVLIPFDRLVGIFTSEIVRKLGPGGELFQAIAVLAVEWLMLYWMYRRKIFLRA